METKVCTKCGRELGIDHFKRNAWGIVSVCKECEAATRRQKKEAAQKAENYQKDVEDARMLRLEDFTPRELMLALKKKGYEGKLKYVRVEEVDISKL